MREHQIVINLKGDEFEELQRLARQAGSKSAGAYLKEHVLTHLGLDDKTDSTSKENNAIDAKELLQINQELARMHRELQVFIAESLSSSYAEEPIHHHEQDFDDIGSAYRRFQETLEVENTIELPPVVDTTAGELWRQKKEPPPFVSPAKPAQEKILPEILDVPSLAAGQSDSGSEPINLGSNVSLYSNVSAESIWITPPGPIHPPSHSGIASGADSTPTDDLENLADRAFSISPRLGTPEKVNEESQGFRKRQVEIDDPLQDLLDDSILVQAEQQRLSQTADTETVQDNMVYAFSEAEQEVGAPPVLEEEDLTQAAVIVESDGTLTVTQAPADESDEVLEAEDEDENKDEDSALKEEDLSPRPPMPQRDPPAGGPPPKRKRPSDNDIADDDKISGGPPPKRRKK